MCHLIPGGFRGARARAGPSLDIECAIVTGALYSDFRQTSTVHNMRCLLSDSELLASDLFVFCIHHHHGHGADLLAGTAAACPLGTSAYLIARRENRIKQTPNHSKLACSAPSCRRSADVRASGSIKWHAPSWVAQRSAACGPPTAIDRRPGNKSVCVLAEVDHC